MFYPIYLLFLLFGVFCSCSQAKWSTASLSQPRTTFATSVGDIALFGGGAITSGFPTPRVDIYNSSSNSWSIATLSLVMIWQPLLLEILQCLLVDGIHLFSNVLTL